MVGNNVSYLLSWIWRSIPKEVIHYAFIPYSEASLLRSSIDYSIRDKVIDGWVLQDTSIVSGQETVVDLAYAKLKDKPGGTIVEIPLSATGGRQIVSALSIVYSLSTPYLTKAGNEVANAMIGPPQVSQSRLQVVGPNIIFAEQGIMSGTRYLRCILENDPDFNNIQKHSLAFLGQLCVVACKAHIYNDTTVRTGAAPIIHGVSYEKISEIIDGYSDAMEIYMDMLRRWEKISHMQDRVSHNRLIRAIMPS